MTIATEEKKTESIAPAQLTVTTLGNHIYFYSAVSRDRCLDLIQQIRNLDSFLRSEQLSRGVSNRTPIWLHIQSGGGDLFAGLSIADQLGDIQSPIYSIVEGVCASAATLISMSCSKRYITPNSFFLVHQLWTYWFGTHEEFKDEMKLQKLAMNKLYSFYSAKTGIKKSRIKEMLKRDWWMDAEEALVNKFVDEIL